MAAIASNSKPSCGLCDAPLDGQTRTIVECNHIFHSLCFAILHSPRPGHPEKTECPCCPRVQNPRLARLPTFQGILETLYRDKDDVDVFDPAFIPSLYITFQGNIAKSPSGVVRSWVAWAKAESPPHHYTVREFFMISPNNEYGHVVFDDISRNNHAIYTMDDVKAIFDVIRLGDLFTLTPCTTDRKTTLSADFVWFPGKQFSLSRFRQRTTHRMKGMKFNLHALREARREDIAASMAGRLFRLYGDEVDENRSEAAETILKHLQRLPRFTLTWKKFRELNDIQIPEHSEDSRCYLVNYQNWARHDMTLDESLPFAPNQSSSDLLLDLDRGTNIAPVEGEEEDLGEEDEMIATARIEEAGQEEELTREEQQAQRDEAVAALNEINRRPRRPREDEHDGETASRWSSESEDRWSSESDDDDEDTTTSRWSSVSDDDDDETASRWSSDSESLR